MPSLFAECWPLHLATGGRYPLRDMASRQRSRIEQRRAVLALSLAAGGLLSYALFCGDRGVQGLTALRATLVERSHDAYRRIVRNRDLSEAIVTLQSDDRRIEEMARARLGVVGRDEVVFVFPRPDPAP
jgi:cell division protein FtsB